MADDSTRLQTIADELEGAYQALRSAASNIAGLLQVGRATCDEVKAYNLWALAIYNTQQGMLDTLRAGGEQGVPDLPTAPTLFTWNGVAGAEAWNLDCGGQPSSLSGVMARALSGPQPTTAFLSTAQVSIQTQGTGNYDPANAPSLATLLAIQQARANPTGLGVVGVLIAIAGIAIAISVAIAAIMHYLDVSAVQEANTQQVRLQAEAFATYTAARLSCYASCTQSGRTPEDCTDTCTKLVQKPNIKLPGQDSSWGLLQWVGFTVLAGGIGFASWKLIQRHRAGRPIFELPESAEAAMV
jgi:hypothetical protein